MITELLIDALTVIAAYLLLDKPNSTIWVFTGGRITSMSTETSAKLDPLTRVLTRGAAGRDFHISMFVSATIRLIESWLSPQHRYPALKTSYPASLSGALYEGISHPDLAEVVSAFLQNHIERPKP